MNIDNRKINQPNMNLDDSNMNLISYDECIQICIRKFLSYIPIVVECLFPKKGKNLNKFSIILGFGYLQNFLQNS